MDIYAYLDEHKVEYIRYDHQAVFTCEEAEKHVPTMDAAKTKNLFVRDRKGKRHFLVVVGYEKQVDLAALSEVLNVKKLSMASSDRLLKHLGVEPGSVTILALANDQEHQVELVLDRPITEARAVRCHPLVNTATLSISSDALRRFLEATGHCAQVVDVPKRS